MQIQEWTDIASCNIYRFEMKLYPITTDNMQFLVQTQLNQQVIC